MVSGKNTGPSGDGHSRNLSEYSPYFGDSRHEKMGYIFTYAYENTENNGIDPIPTYRHSVMAKTDIKLTDDVGVYLKGEASVLDREGVGPATEDSHRVSAGDSWQPSDSHVVQLKGYHDLYYDVPFFYSPFWVQSNPDLEPETSIGYSLGVEQLPPSPPTIPTPIPRIKKTIWS